MSVTEPGWWYVDATRCFSYTHSYISFWYAHRGLIIKTAHTCTLVSPPNKLECKGYVHIYLNGIWSLVTDVNIYFWTFFGYPSPTFWNYFVVLCNNTAITPGLVITATCTTGSLNLTIFNCITACLCRTHNDRGCDMQWDTEKNGFACIELLWLISIWQLM